MSAKGGVVKAFSVSVGRCDECDAAHIYFHNEDGDIVAEGTLAEHELFGLTNDLCQICNDITGLGGDGIGECLGEA